MPAQTNAQRQAAYRQRHRPGGKRLNAFVSTETGKQLVRLARHHGIARRATLEKLVAEAERQALSLMSNAEQAVYFQAEHEALFLMSDAEQVIFQAETNSDLMALWERTF